MTVIITIKVKARLFELWSRDLESFGIRFQFELAIPIRFKMMSQPCLPFARRSRMTKTINAA